MSIADRVLARFVTAFATLVAVAALASAAPADPPATKGDQPVSGRPQRVAVLNFGPPRSWQGLVGGTVGQEITADAWRRAIPLLEKDKVDVVVVRINSGGGYLFELYKFHDVFQKLYKPKFRTVAWVESAISCAAMSIWVLGEFYMLPDSALGAATCAAWGRPRAGLVEHNLEIVLRDMEDASRLAGRDPKVMRAMQIQEPLSYNKDDNGNVTWFQDLSGKVIANPANQILTLNADDAVACKVARAKAATLDELMKAMGIAKYELAGKEASSLIDDTMRQNDLIAKQLSELDAKYSLALQSIRALRGPQNNDRRALEVGVARATLKQMKQRMSGTPNFVLTTGHTQAWFDEQERVLKELSKG